jgi:hypothetical protein
MERRSKMDDASAMGGVREKQGDCPLGTVLRASASREVPIAAWWCVAESLSASVRLRRSVLGSSPMPKKRFEVLHNHARIAAETALAELDAFSPGAIATPRGCAMRPRPLTMRTTLYELAHLVATPRATSAERLRIALGRHLAVLATISAAPLLIS